MVYLQHAGPLCDHDVALVVVQFVHQYAVKSPDVAVQHLLFRSRLHALNGLLDQRLVKKLQVHCGRVALGEVDLVQKSQQLTSHLSTYKQTRLCSNH